MTQMARSLLYTRASPEWTARRVELAPGDAGVEMVGIQGDPTGKASPAGLGFVGGLRDTDGGGAEAMGERAPRRASHRLPSADSQVPGEGDGQALSHRSKRPEAIREECPHTSRA